MSEFFKEHQNSVHESDGRVLFQFFEKIHGVLVLFKFHDKQSY
jgi:hypothetical protein